MFKWLHKTLDDYYSADERSKLEQTKKEIEKLKVQAQAQSMVINKQKSMMDNQQLATMGYHEQISQLKANIQILQEETGRLHYELKLESFWNNKRPKTNLKYNARPPFSGESNLRVDPRIFFSSDNYLPKFRGTNDEIAKEALGHVIDNIKYTADMSQFKKNEVWLFAFETLALGEGDCEDGAILLANILINSGVPAWRVRLNAGDVQGGGHAWVTYLRESDNQWVILDWCYFVDLKTKRLEKTYKDAEKYFSIWFSWNNKYIFKSAKTWEGIIMQPNEWKELGVQCLMGALYGAGGAIIAVPGITSKAIVIVAAGALKGAAHVLVRLLRPKLVAQGMPFKAYHWSEKWDRIL